MTARGYMTLVLACLCCWTWCVVLPLRASAADESLTTTEDTTTATDTTTTETTTATDTTTDTTPIGPPDDPPPEPTHPECVDSSGISSARDVLFNTLQSVGGSILSEGDSFFDSVATNRAPFLGAVVEDLILGVGEEHCLMEQDRLTRILDRQHDQQAAAHDDAVQAHADAIELGHKLDALTGDGAGGDSSSATVDELAVMRSDAWYGFGLLVSAGLFVAFWQVMRP